MAIINVKAEVSKCANERSYLLKVYRIEKKLGGGPYRSIADKKWVTETHNFATHTPGPWEDFTNWGEVNYNQCLFGFRTLAQLRKWFNTQERKNLRRYGYKIVRMEATEIVRESSRQVAFVPDRRPVNPTVHEYAWDRLIYHVTVAK